MTVMVVEYLNGVLDSVLEVSLSEHDFLYFQVYIVKK